MRINNPNKKGPAGRGVGFRLACLLVISVGIVPSAGAQVRLASYAIAHGVGFTSGESVRIGVSVGLPFSGQAMNLDGAGGAGFWYATRDGLLIVANESDPLPDGVPTEFELQGNYPNPFNPSTRIRYGVPEKTFVRIGIFNILGQLVSQIVSEEKTAGYYEVDWNGRDANGGAAPSGVYFYRIHAGRFVATRTMVLQK